VEHPIQGLMQTAMENLKEMIDVNTIVGDPVETPDGQILIPISKVGFGFAAGGSEFGSRLYSDPGGERIVTEGAGPTTTNQAVPPHRTERSAPSTALPFGGGSGGGVSITPIAFVIVNQKGVRLLNMETSHNLFDRLIDAVPAILEKIQCKKKTEEESHPEEHLQGGLDPQHGEEA
jgi:sporulation protein YtfJ